MAKITITLRELYVDNKFLAKYWENYFAKNNWPLNKMPDELRNQLNTKPERRCDLLALLRKL